MSHAPRPAHGAAPVLALALLAAACADPPARPADGGVGVRAAKKPAGVACDRRNGGLTLPSGFCATVFAEGLGAARHLAVRANGDVYVAINSSRDSLGRVVALRDADGDGRAEQIVRFGAAGGNGLTLVGEALYVAENARVVRYPLGAGALAPVGAPEVIVSGLPADIEHVSKTIVVGGPGVMYLNVGSRSNACQERNRVDGSPGMDPCPELATRAGVWRFDPTVLGQSGTALPRVATGLRNTVALAVDPAGALLGVQMNRDNLNDNWPALYSPADDARLPAEELFRIEEGGDYGWPYCYYDGDARRKVLAPEYGGDRVTVGRCATVRQPLLALPGHWAPISMVFYTGTSFPAAYRGGAFVAFHGDYFWGARPGVTTTRSPGYNVVFVPFAGGVPTGEWSVFADGFAGATATSRQTAAYRPTGLALGRDGSLFVADDKGGRIWRIAYRGS